MGRGIEREVPIQLNRLDAINLRSRIAPVAEPPSCLPVHYTFNFCRFPSRETLGESYRHYPYLLAPRPRPVVESEPAVAARYQTWTLSFWRWFRLFLTRAWMA